MGIEAANRIGRRRTRIATALVAAGLMASACGSDGETAEQADTVDADQGVAMVDGSAGDDGAGDDGAGDDAADDGAGGADAGDDGASDADAASGGAGEELAMVETDSAAPSTMGGMDEALAEISGCLEDEGADVGVLTLADMLTKAQGDVPADGDLVEIFAFFLDRDPTDADFIAAVDACEDVVYAAPGIAAFLPPRQ